MFDKVKLANNIFQTKIDPDLCKHHIWLYEHIGDKLKEVCFMCKKVK